MKAVLSTIPIVADIDFLVNSFFELQENSITLYSKFIGNEFENIILQSTESAYRTFDEKENKWAMI